MSKPGVVAHAAEDLRIEDIGAPTRGVEEEVDAFALAAEHESTCTPLIDLGREA